MRSWHFSNFYFFYFTTIGVIVPFWSLYLQHLGFSATEIGQLMGILLLTKVVAPNIWAAVADRIAASRGSALGMLKFASLATLLIYGLMYLVSGFWAVAAVMFGFCVFWNACLPQLEAATLNHLKADREKYGLFRLWGSLGFIVTVWSVGELMDYGGAGMILPAGAVAIFSLLVASLYMRDAPTKSAESVQPTVSLTTLLNAKVLWLLMLCVFMQASHGPFYTFLSIYLEGYGYSKSVIGVLWAVGALSEVAVFLAGYRLLRRFNLAHLLTLTFAVAGVRWCLVAVFPEQPSLIFLSQTLHAVTYGLYHSVMILFIDRMFKGPYQIRGQALYSSVTFGLGGAIGSVASGYVWTIYGKNMLFMSAGILMLFVALVSLCVTPMITRTISR